MNICIIFEVHKACVFFWILSQLLVLTDRNNEYIRLNCVSRVC